MAETLIQTFKRYYSDYRTTSNAEDSFSASLQSLTFHVIDQAELLAEDGKIEDTKSLLRQFQEIRQSTYGSNDSVKERFEAEYLERKPDTT